MQPARAKETKRGKMKALAESSLAPPEQAEQVEQVEMEVHPLYHDTSFETVEVQPIGNTVEASELK